MNDQYVIPFVLAGAALVAIALIWLLVNGFRTSAGWGWALLLFFPSALIFLFRHPGKAVPPLLLAFAGTATAGAAIGSSVYFQKYVLLGERERLVDGERHVTLTGWGRTDYSVLKALPDVAVLQMANADVNDETLKFLDKADQLREIDLNGTGLTDAGLVELKRFPALRSLRLARTAITDAGFQEHLVPLEGLMDLDLTGTKVSGKAAREWKAARQGRKYLK